MHFRHAHAAHPDWSIAVEECLLLLAQQTGEGFVRGANLGFLYLTDGLQAHADAILATLKARTGVASWVGCTGVGVCAPGVEYTDEPALSVMLGRFAPGSFNVFSGTQRPPALGTRTSGGEDAAFTALVHSDPNTPGLPDLIIDMARKVASGYLFGGLASSRHGAQAIADRVLAGGISGVVFGADVNLVSRVSQGCHPLPGANLHTVTRCRDNLIVALDGRRAFEVLLEDAGIRERVAISEGRGISTETRESLQSLGRQGLFVGFEPVRGDAYRERMPRGDYSVRHVLALDPGNGVVAVAAPLEDGQQIRFCTRDETAARKDLVRICAEIRDFLHERSEAAGAPVSPKGAVYVSCLGRGSHMFGEQHEEMRLIERQFGGLPLTGFYASGEIGGQTLYGFTGVLTVFF